MDERNNVEEKLPWEEDQEENEEDWWGRTQHHHNHDHADQSDDNDTLSSLESWESHWGQTAAWNETPSPVRRCRLSTHDSVTILATSSPEIQKLCQDPNLILSCSTSACPFQAYRNLTLELNDNDDDAFARSENCIPFRLSPLARSRNKRPAEQMPWTPKEDQDYCESNECKKSSISHSSYQDESLFAQTKIGKVQRTSISPAFGRIPLADITEGITLSMSHICLYPNVATPSPPRPNDYDDDYYDESNKENIPPPRISHHKPEPVEKLALHRRVSFDELPSPQELESPQPKKRARGHRRNTHVIILDSSNLFC